MAMVGNVCVAAYYPQAEANFANRPHAAQQRDVLHTNTTYPSSVGRLQPGVDGNQQRGINHFGAMPSRTDVYSQTSLNDIVTELTLLRSLCET